MAANVLRTIASRGHRIGRRPQFCDEPQDVGEQSSGNGDLGHLDCDIATVGHHLRADLDQLLLEARQRPILIWGGPGQGDSVAHK